MSYTICGDKSGRYICTRPQGHDGWHRDLRGAQLEPPQQPAPAQPSTGFVTGAGVDLSRLRPAVGLSAGDMASLLSLILDYADTRTMGNSLDRKECRQRIFDWVEQAITAAVEAERRRLAAEPERIAQLIAHRACCGTENDPSNGKLHGYCVVCGVPWPCTYAGKPPITELTADSAREAVSEAGLLSERETACKDALETHPNNVLASYMREILAEIDRLRTRLSDTEMARVANLKAFNDAQANIDTLEHHLSAAEAERDAAHKAESQAWKRNAALAGRIVSSERQLAAVRELVDWCEQEAQRTSPALREIDKMSYEMGAAEAHDAIARQLRDALEAAIAPPPSGEPKVGSKDSRGPLGID